MKNRIIILIIGSLLSVFMCFTGITGGLAEESYAAEDPSPDTDTGTEGEAYAVFDSGDGSLMLFRDETGSYSDGQVEGTKTYYSGIENVSDSEEPKWFDKNGDIVSFSVREGSVIRPKTCYKWFYGSEKMTDFDPSGLDTSETVIMSYMFCNCNSLRSIDLSGISTPELTKTTQMFRDCSSMEICDLSGMDTSKVTFMSQMFSRCGSLEKLDVSGFDTSAVLSSSMIFNGCSNIKLIKLGPDFGFLDQVGLTFPLQRVRTENETQTSTPILYSYSEYSGEEPGWYRVCGKTVAVFDSVDGSLTFIDDDSDEHIHTGETEGTRTYYAGALNTGNSNPPWYEKRNLIKRVSVQTELRPLKCCRWFYGFSNLIECDLAGLDTSKVTDMRSIFVGCSSLCKIKLGEKTIFTVDPPNTGWKRVRALNGSSVSGPEITNITEYDGTEPGTYRLDNSFICACFDSSDGSLTLFYDDSDTFANGQIIGTKTYYTGAGLSYVPPWNDIKASVKSIKVTDTIEPVNVSNWFSGCNLLERADLSKMIIPQSHYNFLKGCSSLKNLVVRSEGTDTLDCNSGLSGIWRNTDTGEERSLVMNDTYTNERITGGNWELITSSTVTVNTDVRAAGGDRILRVYHSVRGMPTGDPVRSFTAGNEPVTFTDTDFKYVGEYGDIEYYDYYFECDQGSCDADWSQETSGSRSVLLYNVRLRDRRMMVITDTVKWEGDTEAERPPEAVVELYRDGQKTDEQVITRESGWQYTFTVPAFDEQGRVYRYDVKEKDLENYHTVYERYDGIRLSVCCLPEPITKIWFRRSGRWFESCVDFRGGKLTVPGDAVFFENNREEICVFKAEKVMLSEEASGIADTWDTLQAGVSVSMDEWLSASDHIQGCGEGTVMALEETDTEIMDHIKSTMGADTGEIGCYSFSEPYPFYCDEDDAVLLSGSFELTGIINHSKDEGTKKSVKKEWLNNTHPEEITLVLEKNGEEYLRKTIGRNDNWEYTFRDIPKYDENGRENEYSVTEKPVKGFVMSKEQRSISPEDKGVRVIFNEIRNPENQSAAIIREFFVAYDRNGGAYRNDNMKENDDGSYEVIFPTQDFDLVFEGINMRGMRNGTPSIPVEITSVELVDSPYIFNEDDFVSPGDPEMTWEAYDTESEWGAYPDRTKMYHYGEKEKGSILVIDNAKLNVIPYTIRNEVPLEIIKNEYREGSLKIRKTDNSGQPLMNAEFSLYFIEEENGNSGSVTEDQPTAAGRTDERGEIIFGNVPCGNYVLKETKAPPGYRTETQLWKAVIKGDSASDLFSDRNVPVSYTDGAFELTNDKTKVVIKKVGLSGRMISGARLAVYDTEGEEIASWISGSATPHSIEGLTEGETYILREISAPAGYMKAPDKSFTVNTGETTEVTMTDVLLPVPTGADSGGVMVALILGIAATVLVRNARKGVIK